MRTLPFRSAVDLQVRPKDPPQMSHSARLAELGAILATGARRLRLSLDGSRGGERDCVSMLPAHVPLPRERAS